MKKIYQKTAVETLTYTMNPLQRVKVIDRKNMYDAGTEVFNGRVQDMNGSEYYKMCRSEIHGLRAEDNVIVITIETANDEY